MALEATAASGARYRLRQAVFFVDRANDPFGGIFGGGGLIGGGLIGGLMGGGISDAGVIFPPDFPDPGMGGFGPTVFNRVLSIDSEENPSAPEIRKEVESGSYRVFLTNGWFVERVDGPAPAEVRAQLVGSATQMVFVGSGSDTVVTYSFETNGEIITFAPRGGVVIRPEFIENQFDGGGPIADGGAPGLPPEFGQLIELNRDALSLFSLRDTLSAVSTNAGLEDDAELLYHSVIDSFASAGNARLPGAIHCGDELVDGSPSLNGFPIVCDRAEAQQFDNLDRWFATAAVSRLDLAPADGAHCGQQRLVFANNAINRMFMIVEAQIPNPHPECGASACAPLAAAWQNLSSTDPRTRGQLLRAMFLTGSAELTAAGFSPFISAERLTVGSGQIRTNSFDSFPWTLREFKVVANASRSAASAVPFPVSESPRGELWNDTITTPVAVACRQNFLNAMDSLVTDDIGALRFIVDDACKDSESQNDFFTEDYATQLSQGSGAFAKQIEDRFGGLGFSATDLANRARFGGSCIGCHQEASGASLGHRLSAPVSMDFPQIQEFTEPCADGSTSCSVVSPALREVFLPQRLGVQLNLLAGGRCSSPSPQDGGSPLPADAGSPEPLDAGVTVPVDAGMGRPPVLPRDAGAPIGVSVDAGTLSSPRSQLPVLSPSTRVEDLVAADQAVRAKRTGVTLGGQPARTTH